MAYDCGNHDRLRPLLFCPKKLLVGHARPDGRIRHHEQEFRLDTLHRLAGLWLLAFHQRLCGGPYPGPCGHGYRLAALCRGQLCLRFRCRLQFVAHGHGKRSAHGGDAHPRHGHYDYFEPILPGHGLPAVCPHPASLDTPLGTGYEDVHLELFPLRRRLVGRHPLRLSDGHAGHRPQRRPRHRAAHHGQPDQQRRGRRYGAGSPLCRAHRGMEVVLLGAGLPGLGRCGHDFRSPA